MRKHYITLTNFGTDWHVHTHTQYLENGLPPLGKLLGTELWGGWRNNVRILRVFDVRWDGMGLVKQVKHSAAKVLSEYFCQIFFFSFSLAILNANWAHLYFLEHCNR